MGTNYIEEIASSAVPCTEFAQKPHQHSDKRVTFPVTVTHYEQRAKIYRPGANFPFYRVAFKVAGQRRMITFASYSEAKAAAEAKVKELHKGQQAAGLTAKEGHAALTIREALAHHHRDTGRKVSAVEAVTTYLVATKLLPPGSTLLEAVRAFRESIAAVARKPLAEAVAEFNTDREAKTVSENGKRPQLNPVYVADTARVLREFSTNNTALAVCDVTKDHLDLFLKTRRELSVKSRNHFRATLTMFFRWCQRRDFLSATTRLLDADGLRREEAEAADVEFYSVTELRKLLDNAESELALIIALQAFGGLRLQEALRLDWRDVWTIPGHVEVSSAKAKTRSRRLVEINSPLAAWLEPHQGKSGPVTSHTLHGFTWQLIQLRKRLKIPLEEERLAPRLLHVPSRLARQREPDGGPSRQHPGHVAQVLSRLGDESRGGKMVHRAAAKLCQKRDC